MESKAPVYFEGKKIGEMVVRSPEPKKIPKKTKGK